MSRGRTPSRPLLPPTHTRQQHMKGALYTLDFAWQTALLNQNENVSAPTDLLLHSWLMPSCHILALLLLLQMLKHVHLSPYRSSMMSHHAGGGVGSGGRSDTLSLNSTMSCSSLSNQDPLSSRSSSYTSLNESSHNLPQHPPSPMVRKKPAARRSLSPSFHRCRNDYYNSALYIVII